MGRTWRQWAAWLAVVSLVACQLATTTAPPTLTPADTRAPATLTLAPPSATPPLTPHVVAATETAAPTQPLEPAAPRPAYTLTATVDVAAHTVAVAASVQFVPPDTHQAVFNFNPLQSATVVESLAVTVNGGPVTPTLDGVWVSVPLPANLTSAMPVTVAFAYRLRLAGVDPGAWGWRGTLGWTSRQLNLGDWYPALAPFINDAWLTPQPAVEGEYATTPLADYTVQLGVSGVVAPAFVAGSGTPGDCAPAWCYTLAGGRFVAYVISTAMQTATLQTAGGVTVTSVYLPEHAAAGQAALHTAAAALDTFSALYGPYPFTHYVQVEGDFYDGMEYAGLSFVGAGYYAEYDNSPRNLVTIIGAHEVAHQWWYNLVGNDPAGEPWLDEALATYAELLFLERNHPEAVDWWWAFRIDWFEPQGAVNSTVYAHGNFRGYVDAVYLRGAQMLRAMRAALGEAQFLAFLQAYLEAQSGQIASSADFWNAYDVAGGDPAALRAEYFGPE